MDTKKPWQSKTIIVNAILGVIASIALFVPGAHVVSDFITSHAAAIGVVWSVIAMALRLITKDKVVLTD